MGTKRQFDIEDIYGLTPLQKGLLFDAMYRPLSDIGFVQEIFEISGPLDADALERSWQDVVARHPVLRSGFSWYGLQEPVQLVHRSVSVPFARLDLGDLLPDERDAALDRFLADDRAAEFDPEVPPLLRLALVRLGDASHRLVMSVHHLLIDGWSEAIVLDEVVDRYTALQRGDAEPLPPGIPFRSYLEWLAAQDKEAAKEYWSEKLAGFAAPTPLGIDRANPGKHGVDVVEIELSEQLTERMTTVAAGQGITLNSLLQGMWAILLSRYSGETDVMYGTVVGGRPPELDGAGSIVGLLLNMLPFRVGVPEDATVTTWLRSLQSQHLDLRQYEYSSIAELHGMTAVPRGTALFDSVLVFENMPEARSVQGAGSSLHLRPVGYVSRTGFPLTLKAVPGRRLWVQFAFEEGRFEREAVARIASHFQRLAERIVADPQATVGSLDIVSDDERQLVLHTWNDTAESYPRDRALHEMVAEQAAQRPDQVAVVCGERELTYRELDERSDRIARRLAAAGVGPEVLVGICAERGPELVTGLLGILKSGGAYLPLDPGYPPERLRFMLADSQASLLVVDSGDTTLSAPGVRVLPLDDLMGPEEGSAASAGPAAADMDRLAYVVYTSGSTGRPKGVAVSHEGVNRLLCTADYLQVEPGDVVGQTVNASFDPMTLECWGTLIRGATLAVIPKQTVLAPPVLAAELRRRKVNVLFLTVAVVNRMADECPDFGSELKQLMIGGEPPDPVRLERLLSDPLARPGEILNLYGPTEITVWATAHPITLPAGALVPAGTPMPNMRIYVLDSQLRPVPAGVCGEVYIGAPGIARGYAGRPRLTAGQFLPDPFAADPGSRMYATGDLGRRRQDGVLELLGRRDHQVKIRGFRVETGEVEQVTAEHPDVRAVTVQARPDASGGLSLVGYVVPRDGTIDIADLQRHLRSRLPDYMVPARCLTLDSLPLNPNGKVDRAALPEPRPQADPRPDRQLPSTDTEHTIAAVWGEVLGLDPAEIGVDDVFFELGGHSLLATSVIARINGALDVRLPLRVLFDLPTISLLAAYIGELPRGEAVTGSTLMRLGDGPDRPFFWIHEGTGNIRRYVPLAQLLEADYSLHGLYAVGLTDDSEPLDDVGVMAQTYLAEIRKVQPHGPYRLGGWSFGGMVAFEMASRLVDSGERVDLLCAVDATPPHPDLMTHLLARHGAYERLVELTKAAMATGRPWPTPAYEEALKATLVECELPAQLLDAGGVSILRLVRVTTAIRRAMARYRPTAYPGELKLFLADDGFEVELERDLAADWAALAGKVEVHRVPGEHLTVMDEPNVNHVAAVLERLAEHDKEPECSAPC
ncbi:amino acid adenylation domain-containing protein [Streptomyces sp. NPDC046805]|uniref:amino acid adenylation domain-containing protein n=1 Tax=Streptomyces sp. NPDC046805 TaxID=3155134 RepID=UPI0033F561CB